ncbi:MAG: molecular chaperone DnaK [candidate division Zixibacteria bacterium]
MTSKEKQAAAIGIDLGTTNSLVSIVRDGQPEILSGEHGDIVPSVINIENDILIIGIPAYDALAENPERTVYSIKRLMGKAASDIEDDLDKLPFEVCADLRGLASVKVAGRVYSPVELSASILRELKKQAEDNLGHEVTKAVITVPAYFDDAQRQATRDAGKIAGLEVMRIINEPTAAALAYGMNKLKKGQVVVYDLGGGTFDISILNVENGIFEVLATAGDTNLGGDDFDNVLIELIKADAEAVNYHMDMDDPYIRAVLKREAENAKKALSNAENFRIALLFENQRFKTSLSRRKFEEKIKLYLDKTLSLCGQALTDAGLTTSDIDEVILVGGSTRIPLIRNEIEKFFNKIPHSDLSPDTAVALGAAIQADILTGGRNDLLLLDVTPLSLGIETMGGVMNVLIPRNGKVPAVATEVFTTYVDGQTAVAINVYQGEREMVADNRPLGRFDLKGIEPQKAGFPRILVSFTLDADGILHVAASNKKTGEKHEITVEPSYGLSREEVNRMVKASFENARDDIEKRLFTELTQESQTVIKAAEKALAIVSDVTTDEREEILDTIDELKEAMQGTNSSILREKLDDLNDATSDLAARIMNQSIGGLLKDKTVGDAKKLAT